MAAMWFITLVKFRRKPTKHDTDAMGAYWADAGKMGVKLHNVFWTLGRFDVVSITEAPDEKTQMKFALNAPTDLGATETLVAVSREEAIKFLPM
jgi:uncharacterized protein with GYD domain